MLNILKDELVLNKKYYLKLILFFSVIFGIHAVLFEMYLKDILEISTDIIVTLPVISQSYVMFLKFRNEKTMTIYSSLPNSKSELYMIRFLKMNLFPIIWLILLIPFKLFGLDILQIPTLIISILMIFGMMIFMDMKVITETFGIIKKVVVISLPIIILITVNLAFIIYLKKVHGQMTYDLMGTTSLLILLAISTTISYQIFKLRKNYKV